MVEYSQQRSDLTSPEIDGEAPPSHLWQFAEDFGGALLSPSQTLREIGRREAILPAMALVVLIMVISTGGQAATLLLNVLELVGLNTTQSGADPGTTAAMLLTNLVWSIIWAPVLWTIVSGLLFGVGYLLGGRGRFTALWAATGFAFAPQLLISPLGMLTELIGAFGAGWQLLATLVSLPIAFGVFIWSMSLVVIAIRETMNVSTCRAFGTLGIVVGGLIFLTILVACLFLFMIIALFAALVS